MSAPFFCAPSKSCPSRSARHLSSSSATNSLTHHFRLRPRSPQILATHSSPRILPHFLCPLCPLPHTAATHRLTILSQTDIWPYFMFGQTSLFLVSLQSWLFLQFDSTATASSKFHIKHATHPTLSQEETFTCKCFSVQFRHS